MVFWLRKSEGKAGGYLMFNIIIFHPCPNCSLSRPDSSESARLSLIFGSRAVTLDRVVVAMICGLGRADVSEGVVAALLRWLVLALAVCCWLCWIHQRRVLGGSGFFAWPWPLVLVVGALAVEPAGDCGGSGEREEVGCLCFPCGGTGGRGGWRWW